MKIALAACFAASMALATPAHAILGFGDSDELSACKKIVENRNAAGIGVADGSFLRAYFGFQAFQPEGEAALLALVQKRPETLKLALKLEMGSQPSAVAAFDKDLPAAAADGVSAQGFVGKWTGKIDGKEVSSGQFICAPVGKGPAVEIYLAQPAARDQVLASMRALKAAPKGDKVAMKANVIKRRIAEIEAALPK